MDQDSEKLICHIIGSYPVIFWERSQNLFLLRTDFIITKLVTNEQLNSLERVQGEQMEL